MTNKSEVDVAFGVLKGLLNEDPLKEVFTIVEATSNTLTLNHNSQKGKYLVSIRCEVDVDNRLYDFMVETKFISDRPEFSPAVIRYEERRFPIVKDEEFEQEMKRCLLGISEELKHCLVGISNDATQKIPRHFFPGFNVTFETHWNYREFFEAVCRYSNIEDFILSHNGEFFMAQTVFNGQPDKFVLMVKDPIEALKLFCQYPLIQREVKFDGKAELIRLLADRAPYLTVKETNTNTVELSVTSEFKRVVFTAFVGEETGSLRTQIEVDGEYKGEGYKPVAPPYPKILSSIRVVNFILDEIEYIGQQILAEQVGLLGKLKAIADSAYALLTEEEKQTYRVNEPIVYHPIELLKSPSRVAIKFGLDQYISFDYYYDEITVSLTNDLTVGYDHQKIFKADEFDEQKLREAVLAIMERFNPNKLEALEEKFGVPITFKDSQGLAAFRRGKGAIRHVVVRYRSSFIASEVTIFFVNGQTLGVRFRTHDITCIADKLEEILQYSLRLASHLENFDEFQQAIPKES